MFAKIWKRLLLFVLIIACLFNVVIKLVKLNSLDKELSSSAQYMRQEQIENDKNK